jgi:hypothetical protein
MYERAAVDSLTGEIEVKPALQMFSCQASSILRFDIVFS